MTHRSFSERHQAQTRSVFMQRFVLICTAAVLTGCGKPADRAPQDQASMDTAASAQATPMAAPAISLADVAGKWKMRTTDEAGGSAVETELNATADSSGWTMTAPKRKPVPVRVVAVGGDSLVTESGPYESFILKGVQVKTRTTSRLQDGKLVGTTEAHYKLKGGRDSVAKRHTVGTRIQ
jgi:hypothetical protein